MTVRLRYRHGVTVNKEDKVCPGYVLFSPINNTRYQMRTFKDYTRVYLLAQDGTIVHYWKVPGMVRLHAELLENGHLLCAVDDHLKPRPVKDLQFSVHRLLELDWDSNIVWEYDDCTESHDRCRMRNGNILVAKYLPIDPELQRKVQGGIPGTEVLADGKLPKNPHILLGQIPPEEVGWAHWQYQVPEETFEKYCGETGTMFTLELQEIDKEENIVWRMNLSEALDPEIDIILPMGSRQSWPGLNTVEEMPDGNILSTSYHMGTCYIWDKEKKTVKWRFGNMFSNPRQERISFPHDPNVLPNGNILLFDNGRYYAADPDGSINFMDPLFSRVIEIDPKTNEIIWEYRAENPTDFYSCYISGARRLSNGNTIICEGVTGRLFEVTMEGETVWEYISPFYSESRSRWGKMSSVYRVMKYEPDYPGLQGKTFDPKKCDKLNRLFGPAAYDV